MKQNETKNNKNLDRVLSMDPRVYVVSNACNITANTLTFTALNFTNNIYIQYCDGITLAKVKE